MDHRLGRRGDQLVDLRAVAQRRKEIDPKVYDLYAQQKPLLEQLANTEDPDKRGKLWDQMRDSIRAKTLAT